MSEKNSNDQVDQTVFKADDAAVQEQVVSVKQKKKSKAGKVMLKILIWLLVFAAIAVLTLFLAAKISRLGTIKSVIEYIKDSVNALAIIHY